MARAMCRVRADDDINLSGATDDDINLWGFAACGCVDLCGSVSGWSCMWIVVGQL